MEQLHNIASFKSVPVKNYRFSKLIAFVLLLSFCVATQAVPLRINVFGDSLSDSGNMFSLSGGLIPPSPPYAGKASNGDVWVEQLAASLGTSAPNNVFESFSLTGDINNFATLGAYSGSFAFPPPDGASTSSNSNDKFVGAPTFPGLQEQIGLYSLLLGPTPMADANAFNIIWAGANDLVFAGDNGSTAEALAAPAVANVQSAIEQLIGLGAGQFVVMNLPDIGQTPFGVFQPDGGADLSLGSQLFNEGLETMLLELTSVNPDMLFRLVDIDEVFSDLITRAGDNPSAAGFPDANAMWFMPPGLSFCLNQDTGDYFCADPPADPDDRIFFDVLHPSSRTHGIVAAVVESALIPLPASYLLVMTGIVAVGASRKRKAAA